MMVTRKTSKGAQDKGWKDEWISFTKSIREGGGTRRFPMSN